MQEHHEEALTLLRGLQSGQISDAMAALDLPQKVILGLTRIDGGCETLVGTAFTIRQAVKTPEDDPNANMVLQGKATRGDAPPGSVIVISAGQAGQAATWGDNHTARCLRNGIAGALIDGRTRDVEAISVQSVPVFARGASPIKSRWSLKTVAVNETLQIDGTSIEPGDVIVADRSGCLVFPVKFLMDVAAEANRIRMAEAQVDILAPLAQKK